jgi:hypothetical protein
VQKSKSTAAAIPVNLGDMSDQWQHQIRLELEDLAARLARRDIGNPVLKPLRDVLDKHRATLVCQLDAFVGYVAEMERSGSRTDPIYAWTRATLENPKKVEKYKKSFTVEVGGKSVYDRELADLIEGDLQSLLGRGIVVRIARHDTNPANNPQPPARFRTDPGTAKA